jgi:TRAP transporter TAXI family solute receptor
MIKYFTKLFVAAGALAAFALGAAQAQMIGIAASNPGSLYHTSATAIAKMANDKSGLKVTVQPFASATVYLPGVNSGEFGFGLANVEELRVIVTGQRWFKGRPHKNLRAAVIMYPLRLALFVRKDSGITTIAGLKGKRVTDGFNSQKTIPPILDAQYATAGMTRKDIVAVRVPNVVAGANAFMQGKADAFLFALGAPKVREANAKVGGIRALPIANTPENQALVAKHFPRSYLLAQKPHPKRNPGILAPMHVQTYDAVVVASTKTPVDVVYKLVKSMHENKRAMASVFPIFNLFNPKRMASNLAPIQWHEGTIKFLKEKGMWPPK